MRRDNLTSVGHNDDPRFMPAARPVLTFVFLVLLIATTGPAAADALLVPEGAPRHPSWLLEVPDSAGDVLVADTEAATMYRFRKTPRGMQEVDRRYMSIGQNGAGKQRAWDRKTPLGIYFITEELDTSRLADKYGVAAFPLDYPNTWDRMHERTGYGIWLHGVDHRNPDRPPFDTDGCLALPNDELLRISGGLTPLETPVVVVPGMRWSAEEDIDSTRDELRRAIESWRASLESGNLFGYLALYADDFRYRDMERPDWSSWRMAVFEKRPLASVTLDDMIILADPAEPGLYLSRFKQRLATDSGTFRTTKRLYWRPDAAGDWKIVAEDSG
jgi:hypothetical protein